MLPLFDQVTVSPKHTMFIGASAGSAQPVFISDAEHDWKMVITIYNLVVVHITNVYLYKTKPRTRLFITVN
jgi:hypothetical protein